MYDTRFKISYPAHVLLDPKRELVESKTSQLNTAQIKIVQQSPAAQCRHKPNTKFNSYPNKIPLNTLL